MLFVPADKSSLSEQNCSVDPAGCEDPAQTDPSTEKMYILRSPDLNDNLRRGWDSLLWVFGVVTAQLSPSV